MPQELDLDTDGLAFLQPGDQVLWSQGSAEPVPLVRALAQQAASTPNLRAFLTVSFGDALTRADAETLQLRGFGGLGAYRHLARPDTFELVPVHFSHFPELIEHGLIEVDAFFVQVAPGDDGSTYNLGVDCGFAKAAIAAARVTVAEVNERMPTTSGNTVVPAADIDYVIRTDRALVELEGSEVGDVERALAQHAAGYISDRDTLQLGIGAVPAAIGENLRSHRNLGIHSGMLGDAVVELVEAGVVTNSHKTIDPGLSVACAAYGTHRLYDFVDQNSDVKFESASYTHQIGVLAQIDNFISINSAVQIDLTGQVNAEVIQGRYVGGVGGQVDFIRGANVSKNGRSIIALTATAGRGRFSRIVPQLDAGVVTTSRADVDVIVTEFGSAELRGRSVQERARALVQIAHPDFRDSLERSVGELS